MVKNKKKWFFISLILAPMIICAIGLLFVLQIQLPKVERHLSVLETSLYTVTPPPRATAISCKSTNKLNNALVLCYFKTDLLHDQIEKYYTQMLSVDNWRYIGSDTVPDTPNNLKSAIYCKDSYAAALYYGMSGQPYSYTFSMSWGLHHCK